MDYSYNKDFDPTKLPKQKTTARKPITTTKELIQVIRSLGFNVEEGNVRDISIEGIKIQLDERNNCWKILSSGYVGLAGRHAGEVKVMKALEIRKEISGTYKTEHTGTFKRNTYLKKLQTNICEFIRVTSYHLKDKQKNQDNIQVRDDFAQQLRDTELFTDVTTITFQIKATYNSLQVLFNKSKETTSGWYVSKQFAPIIKLHESNIQHIINEIKAQKQMFDELVAIVEEALELKVS